MGYMLPTLLLFISIGIILSLTGVMLGIIAIVYRSREAIARALGILILGIVFLIAFTFQDNVIGNLQQQFGYEISTIQSLEVPKLNALKGAPTGVPSGAWNTYSTYIILVQLLFMISIIILGYLGVQVIGVEGIRKIGLLGIIIAIPLLEFILSYVSLNQILNGNTEQGVRYRDLSNILKILSVIISLGLTSVALFNVYRDVGEKFYLVQASGWLILLLGLVILNYITLTSWEEGAIEKIQEGDLGSVINTFRIVTFLLLVGSIGILAGSLLEIVPTAAEAEELEEAGE
ncbi:MAG: hypothetical protein GSR85_11745 [Desulfurococcales archaeon]|nr:hypothetical protein [Desulfurococcales archaeon]